MKKLFATLFAASLMLAVGTQAFAQISVTGGLASNSLGLHQTGTDSETMTSVGVFAGASYDYDLTDFGLSVEPGLFFTTTIKFSEDGMNLLGVNPYAASRYTESTLNIPVMAKYTHYLGEISGSNGPYLKLGPIMQFGLSSKTKTDDTNVPETYRTIDHYKNGDFKRFDLHFGVEAGAEMASLILYIGLSHGLLNLAGSNYPSDVTLGRTMFYAGIGFKLDNLISF
jgi:hypothetical protein